MHLSELSIIANHLNSYASGAVISNIYRSLGGTLIKLFGSGMPGIYFNTAESVIFPSTDLTIFEREPISKLEEGLRANFSGRIIEVSVVEEYGKVIRIKTSSKELFIPFFGGKGIIVKDSSGQTVWSEKNDPPFSPVSKPLGYIPPETENAEVFQEIFFQKIKERKEAQLSAYIEKKLTQLRTLRKDLESKVIDYGNLGNKLFDQAEMIKSVLYSIDGNSRKDSISVTDILGKPLKIELKPDITIIENLQKMYKKAGKYKKGVTHTQKRIKDVSAEINEIENGTFEVPELKPQKNNSSGRNLSTHIPYHEYHSGNGKVFLVGKGAKDNDELTFKIASPHDIWFHAKDQSGSHVIMKADKKNNPSGDDIINGSALALSYSKAKKVLKGDVWMARRKDIVKKKGMAPGKVIVRKGEVKYISLEKIPENLKKIKNS
jgi:predicted ribosome quality control (RQC) complex YloA/Tae2 family protein